MKKSISKEIVFIFALIIDAIAIDILTFASLGISTMTSLAYVISQIVDGLTLGTTNTIVQTFLLVLLMILTKKFNPNYVLSFVVGAIFGILIDLFDPIICLLPNPNVITQVIYFMIGWLLMSFAVALFVISDMPAMPFDAFTKDFTAFEHSNFKKIKTGVDLVFVIVSVTLSLIFLHKIVGIGVGTLIMALFTGEIEGKILDYIKQKYDFKTFTPVGKKLESYKVS